MINYGIQINEYTEQTTVMFTKAKALSKLLLKDIENASKNARLLSNVFKSL